MSEPLYYHRFSCGVEYQKVGNLPNEVEQTYNLGFDFLSIPISSKPSDDQQSIDDMLTKNDSNTIDPVSRSDLLLDSSQWKSVIVPRVSNWLDVDSSNPKIRLSSTNIMKKEISWSAHVAVPALIIPSPKYSSPNYAQIINQSLLSLMNMKIWVNVPISSNETTHNNTWEWWNNFRFLCNHSSSLFVALELTNTLPNERLLEQWLGEPIKCIIIPTNVFEINKSGFPTLSKHHQKFLKQVFKYNIQFLISGDDIEGVERKNFKIYLEFLHNNQKPMSDQEYFEQPYLDYLQAPLQPLMDNLESQTYEIFERDPVKYAEYQRAIGKALLSRTGDNKEKVTTVMVVGAGRGPLVQAAINASAEVDRSIKVYAVEKNPNAVITLKSRLGTQGWKGVVSIVECDMRFWRTTMRADILVSELLGSFGDNELSPECLDGAQRFLATDGISIPSWYTSYVAPISSSRLHNEVSIYNDLKHFETPYVVKPHNYFQLAQSKPLFTFNHPNQLLEKSLLQINNNNNNNNNSDVSSELDTSSSSIDIGSIVDNTRYDSLTFDIDVEVATMHGLLGFFDCCLYDDVHISINPANFSTGMFSWFPIYFPLRDPVRVTSSQPITVHFWRNSTRAKVWYEWAITSPISTPIHNPSGRSYWIGL